MVGVFHRMPLVPRTEQPATPTPAKMLANKNQQLAGSPTRKITAHPTAKTAFMMPPPTAMRCIVIPACRSKSFTQPAYDPPSPPSAKLL